MYQGSKSSDKLLQTFAEKLADTFVQGELHIGDWSTEEGAKIKVSIYRLESYHPKINGERLVNLRVFLKETYVYALDRNKSGRCSLLCYKHIPRCKRLGIRRVRNRLIGY